MFALLLALIQPASSPPAAQGDEIVVTAVRRRCDVRLADQVLSSPDFDRHASEWAAGRPVTVVVPPDAKIHCLAKIMFRLSDHGVKQAVFVDTATDARSALP